MKIIEIGSCCAGVPQIYARYFGTTHIVFENYKYGIHAPLTKQLQPLHGNLLKIKQFYDLLKNEQPDYIHIHSPTIGLMIQIYPVIKMLGIKIIMHYHGTDIRNNSKILSIFSKMADTELVSTPDLLDVATSAKFIPNPYNIEYQDYIKEYTDKFIICHIASSSTAKQSNTIMNVINDLVASGFNIGCDSISGLPHCEVLRHIYNCDIYVDQLRPDIGFYGVSAIEAMGMGKPVISSYNNKFDKIADYPPILSAMDERQLKNQIVYLYENRDEIVKYGEKSQRFAESYHNPIYVVELLLGAL